MHSHSQTNQTHQFYFLLMILSFPFSTAFQQNLEGINTNYLWFFFKCTLCPELLSHSLFWSESVCLISEAFPWDPVPSYPPPSFFFWYLLNTLEGCIHLLTIYWALEGWWALYCLCSYSVFYKSRTQMWFHIWVCLSESIQGSYIQEVIQTMVTALPTLNVGGGPWASGLD